MSDLLDLMGEPPVKGPAAYPDVPGSRYLPTSREAAEGIAPKAEHLRAQAFAFLKVHGPHTADEVAAKMEVSILSMRPRFSELHVQGLIVPTGERRKSTLGNSMSVWMCVTSTMGVSV